MKPYKGFLPVIPPKQIKPHFYVSCLFLSPSQGSCRWLTHLYLPVAWLLKESGWAKYLNVSSNQRLFAHTKAGMSGNYLLWITLVVKMQGICGVGEPSDIWFLTHSLEWQSSARFALHEAAVLPVKFHDVMCCYSTFRDIQTTSRKREMEVLINTYSLSCIFLILYI